MPQPLSSFASGPRSLPPCTSTTAIVKVARPLKSRRLKVLDTTLLAFLSGRSLSQAPNDHPCLFNLLYTWSGVPRLAALSTATGMAFTAFKAILHSDMNLFLDTHGSYAVALWDIILATCRCRQDIPIDLYYRRSHLLISTH
jgi:hypothetical protein